MEINLSNPQLGLWREEKLHTGSTKNHNLKRNLTQGGNNSKTYKGHL